MKRKMIESRLMCEVCGAVMLIPRPQSFQREQGHVKHMYCYECKQVTGFIEGVYKDKSLRFWEQWQEQG